MKEKMTEILRELIGDHNYIAAECKQLTYIIEADEEAEEWGDTVDEDRYIEKQKALKDIKIAALHLGMEIFRISENWSISLDCVLDEVTGLYEISIMR